MSNRTFILNSVFLFVLLILLALFCEHTNSTKLFAVSYYDPCFTQTCKWGTLWGAQNSTQGIGIVMVNPNSGPGSSKDSDYVQIIQNSQNINMKVIGYVATGYGGDNTTTITSQIDDYYAWYPNIDGIFLDEVSTDCSDAVNFYQPLYNYIKSKQASAIVTINPGTNVPECYVNCSTIIVTFESPLSEYTNYKASSWNANYPRERFYHIVYNVPLSSLNQTYQKTQNNYAGYVFISDKSGDNPYDANPTYLLNELNLLNPSSPSTSNSTSTSTTTSSSPSSTTTTTSSSSSDVRSTSTSTTSTSSSSSTITSSSTTTTESGSSTSGSNANSSTSPTSITSSTSTSTPSHPSATTSTSTSTVTSSDLTTTTTTSTTSSSSVGNSDASTVTSSSSTSTTTTSSSSTSNTNPFTTSSTQSLTPLHNLMISLFVLFALML